MDTDTVVGSRRAAGLSWVLVAIGQGMLTAAALYVFLEGWRRTIKVPVSFSIDSLFYLTQAKSTVDNGWWWFNAMLGAPFGLDELAFPANGNVDQIIVWTVSRFVHDALAAVNLSWALMVVITAPVATWCVRKLGASVPSAVAVGTLFALSPYALYRNIAHFGMAIYLVPFVCAAAVQLASGCLPERGYTRGAGVVLLVGSGLLAFNYVYYPFFACFLVCVAAAVGFLTYRQPRILKSASLFLLVLVGCTLLNLAPSLYSWHRYGRPIILVDKVPAQAEVYGLKIRTLVSPTFVHFFPPFQSWAQKESRARFPLETENMTSRLGLVGALGFLTLLGLLLVPRLADRLRNGPVLRGASQLTIAAVLLATIGGFGSLFSLLVSPEIRAYNRICPFIEFFALVAASLIIDSLFRSRNGRVVAAAAILGAGLADQHGAATGMNADYGRIASELRPLKRFVGQLESRLPPNAMVFQLPLRTYLNDSGIARMQPYDHFKLYLVSHQIRWSYPALSNAQAAWQEAAFALDPHRLPYQLVYEGFAAVVVDRYGYEDNGAAVVRALRSGVRDQDILAETDRYVAIDIRPLAGSPDVARTPLPRQLAALTPSMSVCPGQPVMSIDQIGQSRNPFAGPVPVRRSEGIKVSGWAIDYAHTAAAAGVDIAVDDGAFPTFFGADRPDVADYYKGPYRRSGFSGEVPPNALSQGPHTLSLRIVAAGGACYYQSPGTPISVE